MNQVTTRRGNPLSCLATPHRKDEASRVDGISKHQ